MLWPMGILMNRKTILIISIFLFLFSQSAFCRPLNDTEIYDLLKNGILLNPVSDENQVKSQLGKPADIKIEEVQNAYYKNKDITTRLIYPGIKISFYECRAPENKWKKIVSIVVSGQQYKLKHGLKPGMLMNDINQLFKDRESQTWEDSGLTYVSFSMPDSIHDQIYFAVKDGIVQQVIWSDWP
jgi:hypothetical protein